MNAYRMDWSPEITAFAAKSYHGHRGVPTGMDTLVEQLASWNKKKAVARAQELMTQDDRMHGESRSNPTPPDLKSIEPVKLKGLYINKEFDGFGVCKGKIISVDKEIGTERVLFVVEYVDGDREDLYLGEIVKYLRADEVYTHISTS